MATQYKGAGLLTLSLDTEMNLSAATVTKILYKKPSGVTGSWDATVNGTSLTYDLANTDIDMPGNWVFQAYIEVASEKGYGEEVSVPFNQPIL